MQFPIEIDKFKHLPTYKTDLGAAFCGDSLDLLNELPDESINLVITSPIEWVNKRKIRVKYSVNTVWWFSKSEFPKSDVTKVLTEYSPRMKKLLKDPDKFYDPKKRPSGHDIGRAFAKDNGGAIPSNLLQIPNSDSNSQYLRICKILGIKAHPARFPNKLPEFFIRLLTDPGDLVVDLFSGSNTTGFVAEQEGRHWISFDNEIILHLRYFGL
jgi:DNA modification methylase